MNHRRDVHPSRRKCQNFPASCAWGQTCWYKHEEPMEIDSIPEENKWNFKCDLCEETFINCKDFLFHKKKKHSSTILQCEKFLKGECSRADDMCWFKHSRTSNDKTHVVGFESPSKNQVFQKAPQTSVPPDQAEKILQVMKTLCMKVENMEKKFQDLLE